MLAASSRPTVIEAHATKMPVAISSAAMRCGRRR
jgi:hypothetical protein